ncbi:mechanosensitive ion channel domain-containing protein [Biformimicrobium ophioploci]|uniref:Mechanosensitive ion channel n=1 Tax=Biformimicrobium ophioploci TaxID=3036711 RepID=A0ABQ6LUP3_9GAMM|nr:mechanosensitive ion channel domain-containing protein [Microbulbifer sp. NKW57]GMG85762.1 hypothetical protein MNKW57_00830 [Microbulbifer sp. NKW57]
MGKSLLSIFRALLLLAFMWHGVSACAQPLAAQDAQTSGGSEQAFEAVIPDFTAPSAEWWGAWEKLEHEQRVQWLQQLETAWREWRSSLAVDSALRSQDENVEARFQGIRQIWDDRDRYLKTKLLEQVSFPADPDVNQWAASDRSVADGLARLDSLVAEIQLANDSLDQSRSLLDRQLLKMRDAEQPSSDHERAAARVFLAQVNHLLLIERRERLVAREVAWKKEMELASAELQRMLSELKFSEKVEQDIAAAIEALALEIEKLLSQRAELQSALLQKTDESKAFDMRLSVMLLDLRIQQKRLERHRAILRQHINAAADPTGETKPIKKGKRVVEGATRIRDVVGKELAVKRTQLMSWLDDNQTREQEALVQSWWQRIEEINSVLKVVSKALVDVERYNKSQLTLVREQQGLWAAVGEDFESWRIFFSDLWQRFSHYTLFDINNNPVTIVTLLQILLAWLIAYLASRITRRALRRLVDTNQASESTVYSIGRVSHYAYILIAFLASLMIIGLDTTSLTVVAGALSVGIGFGLQEIFGNFVSGLILLFERPLKVGDLVELESGVFGRIRAINVRSTRITTRDNVDILVPNSEFVAGRVINHTLDDPIRRIHVDFGVAYGSDPAMVQQAAMEAADKVVLTHTDWNHKTEVWLVGFGESSLDFKLVVWINSNRLAPLGDPYAQYNVELLESLTRHGIEIPFPQRDLRLRSWDDKAWPAAVLRRNGGRRGTGD